MKPFLSAYTVNSTDTSVHFTGKYSTKILGKLPSASGYNPRPGLNASTKLSKNVIRLNDKIYTFLRNGLWEIKEGETNFRLINVHPQHDPNALLLAGPYYFIDDNSRPSIAWMECMGTNNIRMAKFDGIKVSYGIPSTFSIPTNTIFFTDGIGPDFAEGLLQNNLYHTDGSNTTIGNIYSSGISVMEMPSSPTIRGFDVCNVNNSILQFGESNGGVTTGPFYFFTFNAGQGVVYGLVADSNGGSTSKRKDSIFPGFNNSTYFVSYCSPTGGFHIKEMVPSVSSDPGYFVNTNGMDREKLLPFLYTFLLKRDSLFADGKLAIRTTFMRNNYDFKKVTPTLYISSTNTNGEGQIVLNLNYSTYPSGITVGANTVGNAQSSFPFNKVGDGCFNFDGNWANIQIEGISNNATFNGNSRLSFRLYESSIFPSGTQAIVTFIWSFGTNYPNRHMAITAPSHGYIDDVGMNRGITFGSGILYSVDIDGYSNGLINGDGITIIPVASGIL